MRRDRWRTKIRRKLPWLLIDIGFAAKGRQDCGGHEWYREDANVWRCYHCTVGEHVGEDPYVSEAPHGLG
jgi:hypothetical protein